MTFKAMGAAAGAIGVLVALALVFSDGEPAARQATHSQASAAIKRLAGGRARIEHGRPVLHGLYVGGRRFRTATKTPLTSRATSAPALQPLTGEDLPIAVRSPDGTRVAYDTWRWIGSIDPRKSWAQQGVEQGDALGFPTLYVRDARTGADTSLGAGTMSPAFRRDGALAYARAIDPPYRLGRTYRRAIVVRDAHGETTWSSGAGAYSPRMWVGQTLIAYRAVREAQGWDVLAFDGPGKGRLLARSAQVVAVDPSGSGVLIADEDLSSGATTALRVVNPANGATRATLQVSSVVDPATGEPLRFADGTGDWRGDAIVVRADAGLLILRFASGTLTARSFLHVDVRTGPLKEPRFADATHHVIDAWTHLPRGRGSARLRCDVVRRSCLMGAPAPPSRFGRPVAS